MRTRLLIAFILAATVAFPSRAQSPPVVNVFSRAPYVTEGGSLYFIFRKDGSGTAHVPFTFAGSAISGVNFSAPPIGNSIVIPDGLSEFYLQVRTLTDRSTNTDVTLFLQLQPDPSYQTGIAGGAGARILQYIGTTTINLPPYVTISATQWSDRVDFKLSAIDNEGVARIWLVADTNILTSFSFPTGQRIVSTNFSWTNPPVGRHEISAIGVDNRGAGGSVSNTPPVVILVGDQFTFPKEGAASIDSVTLTADLVTSFDTAERHRRLLLEFAIPTSATNSEGYLKFSASNYSSESRTEEIYAYNGDGLLSTNDLFVAGEPVLKFLVPPGMTSSQLDITPVIRNHAGGFLGLWINDTPNPARTSGFGELAARFSDFKLEILDDSSGADEPTTVTWQNPPVSRRVPFFDPLELSFRVVDHDSRVTAVELHSAESGLIARTEGILFLGTNIVSLVWTNPIPGKHTLFLRTFNEDNATATIQLGQLEVESLNATVTIPPPSSPSRPAQNPFPISALVFTPTGGTFQAELSLLATGEVLDHIQIKTVAGTNEISLAWTNPTPGTNIFLVRISDDQGNSSSAASSPIVVSGIDHEWLYSGENIQSFHVADAAGRARVWGYGYDGDLGLGFRLDAPYFLSVPAVLPQPFLGLEWKQIVSSGPTLPGTQFHLGLANDGSLYAWGYNVGGIFRLPTSVYHIITPVKIAPCPAVSWYRKIACGRYLAAAIDQSYDIWLWGPSVEPIRIPGPWLDLRMRSSDYGAAMVLAISTNGSLVLIRPNYPNQSVVFPGLVKPTRDFATCLTHSLAIADDGQLYAWGDNSNGQLPFPTVQNSSVAQPINGVHIAGVQSWTKVAAGTNLNLAVDNNGRLFAWGSSTNSGVRNPVRNQPGLVDIPETGFVDIAVTPTFAMALSQRGNLYIWGVIFAPETPTHRRTIRFPELVQGLPDLLEPTASATLTTFDPTGLRSSTKEISLNLVAPLSTPVQIQTSSDLQTWRTLTNFTTDQNRTSLSAPIKNDTNVFFRVR